MILFRSSSLMWNKQGFRKIFREITKYPVKKEIHEIIFIKQNLANLPSLSANCSSARKPPLEKIRVKLLTKYFVKSSSQIPNAISQYLFSDTTQPPGSQNSAVFPSVKNKSSVAMSYPLGLISLS